MKLKCIRNCSQDGTFYAAGETYEISADSHKSIGDNFEKSEETKKPDEPKPDTEVKPDTEAKPKEETEKEDK